MTRLSGLANIEGRHCPLNYCYKVDKAHLSHKEIRYPWAKSRKYFPTMRLENSNWLTAFTSLALFSQAIIRSNLSKVKYRLFKSYHVLKFSCKSKKIAEDPWISLTAMSSSIVTVQGIKWWLDKLSKPSSPSHMPCHAACSTWKPSISVVSTQLNSWGVLQFSIYTPSSDRSYVYKRI